MVRVVLSLIGISVSLVGCTSPIQPTALHAETSSLGGGVAATTLAAESKGPITVTPPAFAVDGAPQVIRGRVEAAPGVPWTITTETPWITIVTARGTGSGPFVADLTANLCTSLMRVGHLRLSPGDVTVRIDQDGSDLGICPAAATQ